MKLSKSGLPRFPAPLTIIVALLAAATPAWSGHDHLRNEVRKFHAFLHAHPKLATELRHKPNLANSKKYLNKHDDLDKFLKRHPNVKREIANHPSRVFGNYYREAHARWRHHNR